MKKLLNTKFINIKSINTTVIAGLAALALTACGGSKSDSSAEIAPAPAVATADESAPETASTTGGRGSQITLADSSTSRSTGSPAAAAGNAEAPTASDASVEVTPAADEATDPAADASATVETPADPAVEDATSETGAGSAPVVSIPVIDFGKLPPAVTIPVLNLAPTLKNPVADCFRGGMRVNVEVSTRFSLRSVVVQRANIFGATITTSLGWLGPDTGSGNVWNGVNVGGTSSAITIVATDVNGLNSSVTVETGLSC